MTQPAIQHLMYVLPYGSADPFLISKTIAVTSILGNSTRITTLAFGSDHAPAVVVLLLLTQGHAGVIVKHPTTTTQFQPQGQLLEEAKRDLAETTRRDLETYKKEVSTVLERDRHDLEERFERENQALKDEIRQLKERGMRDRDEIFEQERRVLNDLNDWILQLKVILFPRISNAKSLAISGFPAKVPFRTHSNTDNCVFPLSNQAILTREKRAMYQQNPPQVHADTRKYVFGCEGPKAAQFISP